MTIRKRYFIVQEEKTTGGTNNKIYKEKMVKLVLAVSC